MLITCLLVLGAVDGGVPPRVQPEPRPGPAGEVSGVVTDDRGTPIAGAKLSFRGGNHHKVKYVNAETGPDGRFTATGVSPTMYGAPLEVTAPGFSPVRFSVDQNALHASLSLKIRMGRPMKIEGVITAPDATGGSLRLINAPPPGANLVGFRSSAMPLGGGVLGADGSFALEAPEGEYELEWARPSGTPFHVVVHAPSSKLRLAPKNAGVEGQVLTRAGSPLASNRVVVRTSASPYSIGQAETDAQGRFAIYGLDDGDYVLEVTTSDRLCRSQPVKVARGIGKATVRLGGGWELHGQVLDAAGHGKASVPILVKPVQLDGSLGPICDMRGADTDAEGRFSITELIDAEVEVSALVRPESINVKVKPGAAPLTLTVPALLGKRTVSGVVLGPDRKPLAGAMVGTGRTDDQGLFTLERAEGTSGTLQFYRRCFVPQELPETKTAVVVMERRPCLSVNVVDAAKKPVSGMHSLQVKRADGSRIADCNTRTAEGDCTLEAELGKLLITGTLQDGRSVSTALELTSTEKQEVYVVAP